MDKETARSLSAIRSTLAEASALLSTFENAAREEKSLSYKGYANILKFKGEIRGALNSKLMSDANLLLESKNSILSALDKAVLTSSGVEDEVKSKSGGSGKWA